MAAGGATPRKFAEKIAMHNQKGAEENAEFNKIMSEIARVKGNAAAGTMQSPRPPPTLTNPLMLVGGPRIHLSPNFPSAVPRHGSLPNVAANVNLQQQNIQNAGGAPAGGTVTLNNGGVNQMFAPMETVGPMMNQSSPMAILNPNSHHHQHNSLRDSMVGSSGGSATQIHNIRGSSGPIRSHKHRKDTSPYGNRLSSTDMGPASASHLSPPDNSGNWRRVRSDPFLHHNSINGSSTGVSPSGSISDTPNAILGSNGAISPLTGASPTMPRRVPPPSAASSYNSNSQLPTIVNNVQNTKNNYQLGLPIPEGCGGAELKPGSLPNLTNLEIGHSNHPHHQDANQSNCGGGPQQNNEESPISSTSPQWSSRGSPNSPHNRTNEMSPSVPNHFGYDYTQPTLRHSVRYRQQSMSATSGGSSSYVRFSDNEISKILSIPVSMLSESSQEAVSCTETQAKTNVSSATAVCDNASRNLLHLNKGIAVDQSTAQQNNIMYGTNVQIKTEDGQNMVDVPNMSNYRNPQSIQPPPSPVMQGSPLGRSASPIDFVGSPHSPSTLGGTGPPGQQPQSQSVNYPDAMALAGQNYFMDLTNEVQKMTVLENQPNEQGMYIPTTGGFQTQQPINEFVELFNNQQQQQHDSKNSYQETNPQTPSSIPEIILTGADDGSDQALQRMLGQINNDNLDCFLDGDLKEGLGKLDDNMMRLLSSDNDQLADAATEEHLKKV